VSDVEQGRWRPDFFREHDGSMPVRERLDRLPDEIRGKVIARIDLLRKGGPALDYPYTSQIEGKLRELRLRMGKTRYRVLYCFDEDRTAMLLHGFTKNTAAVEEGDKRIGRARMATHGARLISRRPGKAEQPSRRGGKRDR
jgi:phage-related protein